MTAVKDGDTIEMLVNGRPVRIRLFGVDSPEKGQAFGEKARQFTADLCFGKKVKAVQRSRDQYRRVVADVYLADGTSLNVALVRAGFAWHYKQFSKSAELAAAEAEARQAKRGLWHDHGPTAPWNWRKQQPARHAR